MHPDAALARAGEADAVAVTNTPRQTTEDGAPRVLDTADAIVVFGAAVWPTGPSLTLRVRVARAAELYAQERAPTILCTGGWSNGESEAQVMRAMLIEHGVPAAAIIPDDGGVTTREAIRSVQHFGGGHWQRVIAVSSPYHMDRIGQEARRQRVDVALCAAERPGPRTWRHVVFDTRQHLRELVAAPVYAVTWQLDRLLQRGLGRLARGAVRHVYARVKYLAQDADAVAAASDTLAHEIKTRVTRFSDTEAVLTPASGLRMPVRGPAGDRFGIRHGRLHAGIDLRAAYGSRVVAAAGGLVLFAGGLGPYGNVIVIDHGGGLTTVYAHLAGFVVAEGDPIDDGQLIGFVGATGRSSGAHLHVEVRVHGSPVDPSVYLSGAD